MLSSQLWQSIHSKPWPSKSSSMQGFFAAHQAVQVGHAFLHAAVRVPLQQVPLQAAVEVPFVPLAELARP